MRGGFWNSEVSAGEAGATLSGTSKASIIPVACRELYTPAPYFGSLGEFMRIRAAGILSTAGSSPGTLSFGVKIGSVEVITLTTPTMAVSLSNVTWILDLWASLYVVGAAAKLRAIASLLCDGIVASKQVIALPASSPADGTAFDAAVPGLIDLVAQFSATGNSLTLQHYNPILPIR